MWHCDQLEKFPTYAEARFVQPAIALGGAPQVRRIQYTLDVATHPTPGRWYDLVKDEDTGAESFVPAAPKPPPTLEEGAIPAVPAAPPPPPQAAPAAPADQAAASSAAPSTAASSSGAPAAAPDTASPPPAGASTATG